MRVTAEPVNRLIDEFNKLPGIGPKSAARLAYFVLRGTRDDADALAQAIMDIKDKIVLCSECFNITEHDPCVVCASASRDRETICVVEEPLNILAIEKTGEYNGLYHVLHGNLDPLNGRTADTLKIRELVDRVKLGTAREIIFATNPNYEGRVTATYIKSQLEKSDFGGRVTELATGLPIGGDIEYADEVTLAKALRGRRDI